KLQALTAELERSNKELEQFAYVASHDLQEPLRMIASYSQLLEKRYRDKLDQDANEFIGFAVEGVSRMQRLINDLLAYSRIGTRGKEFTPVDCHALVGQVIANLQVAIQETGAVITCDPLPTVQADESQMIQLFQNLIGNAIKFHGTEPPRVHISAKRTEDAQSGQEAVSSRLPTASCLPPAGCFPFATTASASRRNTASAFSSSFSGCTRARNIPAPASDSRLRNGSSSDTTVASGSNRSRAKARRSILLCQQIRNC
ncbi:MAG: hypothetical protein L0Y55_08610, partial [Anaerolineales bacterium]|nr:hypothetical protein [Anaerolineales bacterium]